MRVTGTALAAHLACTRETISDYIANKIISKGADGKYDQDECRGLVLKHLRDKAAGRTGGGNENLSSERAALAKQQTVAVSIKNAAARGDLVSLPIVRKMLAAMFAVFRERQLTIPGKMADALSMRPREEIEELLRDELCEALDELHDPTVALGGASGREDDKRSAPRSKATAEAIAD